MAADGRGNTRGHEFDRQPCAYCGRQSIAFSYDRSSDVWVWLRRHNTPTGVRCEGTRRQTRKTPSAGARSPE